LRLALLSLALLCACAKKKKDETPPAPSAAPVAVAVADAAPEAGVHSVSMLVGLSKDRSRALVYVPDRVNGPGEYRSLDIASKRVLARWTLHALEGKHPAMFPGEADYGRDWIKEKLAHPQLADDVRKQGDALAEIDEPQPGFGGTVIRLANGAGFIVEVGNGFYLAQADGKLSRRWGEPTWRSATQSPDGKTIAFLDDTRLAVSAMGDEPSPRKTDVEVDDSRIGAVRWATDSRSIFVKTKACIERIDLRAPTARVTHVYCLPPEATSQLWVLSPNRKWLGIVFNRGRGDLFAIVDVASKLAPEEQPGPFTETAPEAISDDGVIVLTSYDYRDPQELITVSAKKPSERSRIPSANASKAARLRWLSAKTLAYAWHDTLETIDVAP
jgi:hypothetical protein